MEFSIFRLEIRGILFGIAVLCYIVYCIKKESFYFYEDFTDERPEKLLRHRTEYHPCP